MSTETTTREIVLSDTRDYLQEMDHLIIAATGQSGYVPALVAHELVRKLQGDDPELLFGWLRAQAEVVLTRAITTKDLSKRATVRRHARAHTFGETVRRGGDLSQFMNLNYPTADGARRKLADLTPDDLAYVTGLYEIRAAANAMEAAFFRALAAKVNTGKVSDFFTEEDLYAMRRSLNIA